ncbi:MAG: OmpA family protein [Terracidiphilus sp.]|jgi:outer membrane protein OmpA-like peptidoglycan-associated protein
MATASFAVLGATGCATKNYVKTQTAPIIQKTGEVENQTAENNRQIHNVDESAQAGIKQAQSSADTANQNAQQASTAAGQANTAANDVAQRADSLDAVVKGLDNYKQIGDVSVNFGFDKSVLTADDKQQLDSFGTQLASSKSYILEVTGGTDSVGPADYNYDLSNRRADAVVQYLATKYNVPAHRFYLIGIGKDQAVADNKTREGRAKNRRVEIQMLTNMQADNTAPTEGSNQPLSTQPGSAQPAPAASPASTTGTSSPADTVNE